MNEEIFTEYKLGGLTLKNRVVRSATNEYCGNRDGSVSEKQMAVYEHLAQNHVGLIVTGNFYIEQKGMNDETQNSLAAGYAPASVKELTSRVHRAGAPIIAQINHAGCQSKNRPDAREDYANPALLDHIEIERIAELFADAAQRAADCGFDGIQLHCGHGYLLSRFIDPATNDRTDEFGGPIENRFAFAELILQKMRTRLGEDYPILIKINSNTPADYDFAPDLLTVARICEKLNITALELSGFDFIQMKRDRHNFYTEPLKGVRGNCSIPLILTGGIRNIDDLTAALHDGADLVGISRPLICEPDFVTRLEKDRGYKSRCISCNKCFTLYKEKGKHCVFH